jgi:hypothetical protein
LIGKQQLMNSLFPFHKKESHILQRKGFRQYLYTQIISFCVTLKNLYGKLECDINCKFVSKMSNQLKKCVKSNVKMCQKGYGK